MPLRSACLWNWNFLSSLNLSDRHTKKADRTGTASLTVNVSGTEVTGTLSDPSGHIWQLQNGKLEASQLTFDVTARQRGGSKNVHFFGQIERDSITMHNESNGRPGQTMIFHKIKE
jgi:hypothetical protein